MNIVDKSVLNSLSNLTERLDEMPEQQQNEEIQRIISAARKEQANYKSKELAFPVDAFPGPIRDILLEYQACSGLPVEYYFGYALLLCSALIGNKFRCQIKSDWKEAAIIYMAIVGPPSAGKTPVQKKVFAPLYKIIQGYKDDLRVATEKWKQECFEKENSSSRHEKPEKPKPKEILLDEATIEAIYDSLKTNPVGLLMLRDEISGWVKSFNQYRAGSDEEFWLETWNNPNLRKINRKNEISYLERPFISIGGGIQPGILPALTEGGKGVNGFLARILFIYPERMELPKWNANEPHPNTEALYLKILNYIQALPSRIVHDEIGEETHRINSFDLPCTDAARGVFVDWFNRNVNNYNSTDEDSHKAVFGKMPAYVLRFSLLFSLMMRACDDEVQTPEVIDTWKVDHVSMKNATILAEYFISTAMKVLTKTENPVGQLSDEEKALYTNLPDEFKTSFAIKIGEGLNWHKKKVARFLNNKAIFRKQRQGYYSKMFAS